MRALYWVFKTAAVLLFLVLIALSALFAFAVMCGGPVATVVLNTIVIRNVARQAATARFPTVPGVVVRSEVIKTGGPKGDVEHPHVEYEYQVHGHRYRSNQVNAVGLEEGFASDIVHRYSAGSKVVVHYRADRPDYAVLRAGLDGPDILLPLVLLPLDGVSLLFAWILIEWWSAPEAGVRVRHDGIMKRVRLPAQPTPVGVAVICAIFQWLMTLIIFLALQIFADRFERSGLRFALIWATAVLLVPLLAYVRRAWPVWRGREDLTISPIRQEVWLPQFGGRSGSTIVGFRDVLKISVEELAPPRKNGMKFYVPTMEYRDSSGSTNSLALTKWTRKKQAEKLAAWLRKQIGLEERQLQ